jgi:small subunit ribosomal protein S20
MITKSAKKAYRQNLQRREKNLKRKNDLKKVIKAYKKAVSSGNPEEAKSQLSAVYKKLDKAAKVNLIKKNKSSRLKSRLSALLTTK